MLRITDKGFQYTPSFSTDLKKRFRQMMRDQQRAGAEGARPKAPSQRVAQLGRRQAPKA